MQRLNDDMMQSLHLLYAPLISNKAISLYETMYALGILSNKIHHHMLIVKCEKISMELFHKLRMELERLQLLKTYHHPKNNEYIYIIYPPKIAKDFLRDEILGRMYIKECGEQMYGFMKQSMHPQHSSLEGYEHISAPLQLQFAQEWSDEDESLFHHVQIKEEEETTDTKYLSMIQQISPLVLPMSARTQQTLTFIAKWASVYGLDEVQLKRSISRAMNYPAGVLQQDKFLAYIRSVQGPLSLSQGKDDYDCSPIIFLRRRQNGIDLSFSDKKIIEMLIEHYQLPHEVINIMIEYILERNHQNLNKNYVEKVASSWVRLKIDTKEKAFAHIQNGYQNQKEDWLDRMQQQNQQGQDNPEEAARLQAELAAMMQQLGGNQ